MQAVFRLIRRWLARRNYVLVRESPEIPPTLTDCLKGSVPRADPSLRVLCLDNDVGLQSELLGFFRPEQIEFNCPVWCHETTGLAKGSHLPVEPSGPFIAVLDLETASLAKLTSALPWLRRAHALLLCGRLGSFWSDRIDACSLPQPLRDLGFSLADVVGSKHLATPQAPASRLILVCPRADQVRSATRASRYRVNEALTYAGAPIVREQDSQLLAGRGSFGFAAGVFNPGAIVHNGTCFLLARGDRTPWTLQKKNAGEFFSSTQPWLMTLTPGHQIDEASAVTTVRMPDLAQHRIEDFRLFRFRGDIFSNHAVIFNPGALLGPQSPLPLERLHTRVGLSRLDPKAGQLTWAGWPEIDRPRQATEKNWVMFGEGERLLLLYSFSPYILLTATAEWNFQTLIEESVEFPFGGDGLSIRNSINPVEYDEQHWLHIVHKVYPQKQYAFWAVLISRSSLRPVRVTRRPLVRGWHSFPASIIYTCSAVVDSTHVHLFSGLDDSSSAVSTLPRSRLDGEWVDLSR